MIYTKDCETSIAYTKASPLLTILKVTKGLVYKVEVEFPVGCRGTAHVVICDGGYQAWPSTPGSSWHSDGGVISFDDLYLKEAAPFEFSIYTYLINADFSHTPQIRIGMVSKEAFKARFMPTTVWKEFVDTMKQLQEEQTARAGEILAEPFPWLTE